MYISILPVWTNSYFTFNPYCKNFVNYPTLISRLAFFSSQKLRGAPSDIYNHIYYIKFITIIYKYNIYYHILYLVTCIAIIILRFKIVQNKTKRMTKTYFLRQIYKLEVSKMSSYTTFVINRTIECA